MNVDWAPITRATSPADLRAAVTSPAAVLDQLLTLAERLEAAAAPMALLTTLELAVQIGGVDSVVARRDALLASARLRAATTDEHIAEIAHAACALADRGDAARAVDTYLGPGVCPSRKAVISAKYLDSVSTQESCS